MSDQAVSNREFADWLSRELKSRDLDLPEEGNREERRHRARHGHDLDATHSGPSTPLKASRWKRVLIRISVISAILMMLVPTLGIIRDAVDDTALATPMAVVDDALGAVGLAEDDADAWSTTKRCYGRYVKRVTWDFTSRGLVVRVDPTTFGRQMTRWRSWTAWHEVQNCVPVPWRPWAFHSQTTYDQFKCHAYASVGALGRYTGGDRWDLESWRSSTGNWWTWFRNKCNW